MAKDPAFLFYTGDFSTGTQFFSDAQVGKYLRLLMAQHQHGHLTKEQMMFICGTYDEQVFKKFIPDAAGTFFNERLEFEIERRKSFVQSRSNNRKDKKNISSSYEKHMSNHMENENKREKGKKKEKKETEIIFPFVSEVFLKVWVEWKKYKSVEHKFNYKSPISEQASLHQLQKLSENNEGVAIQIILQSITNGWKGFFKLKDENGKSTSSNKHGLDDLKKRAEAVLRGDPGAKL